MQQVPNGLPEPNIWQPIVLADINQCKDQ